MKLQNQKKELEQVRKGAISDLQRAREMGDLKENGFYRGAKNKVISIDRQLRSINFQLRFGIVSIHTGTEHIELGSTVLIDDGKIKDTIQLVGAYEANPLEKKISIESPVGKQLIGKKAGDAITITIPKGEVTYTVIKVS